MRGEERQGAANGKQWGRERLSREGGSGPEPTTYGKGEQVSIRIQSGLWKGEAEIAVPEHPGASLDHPKPFELRVVESGKMVLARIDGPLDMEHAPEVLQRLKPYCGAASRIVVDLRRTDYLDSAGVRTLLQLQEGMEAQEEGCAEFRLVLRPDSRVQRTLNLLRLESRFNIFDSASAAWIRRSA